MDSAKKGVLFLGGPLHGTRHAWDSPPDYYPHVIATGMVPYARRTEISITGVEVVYAPVGMTLAAVRECISRL